MKTNCVDPVLGKRQNHIVWLHTLATLLVVIGHGLTIINNVYSGDNYQIQKSIDFIYLFHVPLFMCISGYLFQYSEVENRNGSTPFATFCKKKAFRLMVPFIIVLFLYTKPIKYLTKVYTSISISFIISTHHLWYLYVLFIISILGKIVIQLVRKNRFTIVITAIISIFLNIVSIYFEGPIHHILFYCYFFILGVWLRTVEKKRTTIWRIGVVCCCLWSICFFLNNHLGRACLWLNALTKLNGASMIILLIWCMVIRFKDNHPPNIVSYLSMYSMGIYLFHEPLMNIFAYVVHKELLHIWIYFLIMSCTSILGAISITFLLRKLKLGAVIGE